MLSKLSAGAGGDNEVQRTMLEIVNQLDGFDSRGNIKVLPPALCCCEGSCDLPTPCWPTSLVQEQRS